MATTTPKDALHHLIDEMPDEEVERLLRLMQDPVLRTLELAPPEDEPLTPEDEAALQEGRRALARGEVFSLAEL